MGIVIIGLEIDGALKLGARQTVAGRDGLLGFGAERCTFRDPVNLRNARCESLYFTDCEFL